MENQANEIEHTWQLRLERARYEAERAFRQFDAVEPENRLVVRTLERRWNEKLQQLAELEQTYTQVRQVHRLELTEQQRQQILRLAPGHSCCLAFPNYNRSRAKRNAGIKHLDRNNYTADVLEIPDSNKAAPSHGCVIIFSHLLTSQAGCYHAPR